MLAVNTMSPRNVLAMSLVISSRRAASQALFLDFLGGSLAFH